MGPKQITWRGAIPFAAGFGVLAGLSVGGEFASRLLRIGIPGPILGMGAYLLLLWIAPRTVAWTLPAARALTRLLGALIVPAAVGLAAFLPLIAGAPLRLATVLVVSTVATGVGTALLHATLTRRQA